METAAKGKILVVDDDKSIGLYCKAVLRPAGFDVTTVENAQMTLDALKKENYDLIIVDIILPDINGIELVKKIKEEFGNVEIIVLMMSGSSNIKAAVESMKAGAADYISKPFQPHELKLVVSKCLEKQNLVREIGKLKDSIALYELSQAMISLKPLNELLELILELAIETVNADGGSIMLFDKGKDELEVRVASGSQKDIVIGKRFKLADRFAGKAAQLRQPLLSEDVKDEAWFKSMKQFEVIKSGMSVPIQIKNELIGTVNLKRTVNENAFTDWDAKFTSIFAQQAAFAINNAKIYDNLKGLDKLKSEFISNVSHELKTPLMSMRAAIELLLGGETDKMDEEEKTLLEINNKGIERLENLVTDLLDFSKIEVGILRIKKEKICLPAILKESINSFNPLATKNNLTIGASDNGNISEIEADPKRIKQVVDNLISNAIKFTPAGGKIEISISEGEKEITVTVADTGIGIAEGEVEKIFDKFYMVDSSFTRQAQGIGLGLSIVKEIIRNHGGKIWVTSEPGKGSNFIFTLLK